MNEIQQFLRLSDETSKIKKILSKRKGKSKFKKQYPFVVVNSDNNYGYYTKTFIRVARENGLVCQQANSTIRKIRKNDLIVFGDSGYFDYRIVKDVDLLRDLDGRRFKAYDLITHFQYALRRLEKYISSNKSKQQDAMVDMSLLNLVEVYDDVKDEDDDININLIIEEDDDEEESFFPRNLSNILFKKKDLPPKIRRKKPKRSSFDDELITIHEYWVKVGYDQYDIYKTALGEEYIIVDDDELVYIRTDRNGRKYLDFE